MEETKKKSIKHWDEMDKPREKLLAKGKDALSDSELLGILLGSGTRDLSAVELAREILTNNNSNLNSLAALSVADLMKYKGIGEAKAITITAALELGRRRRESEVLQKRKITSSHDIFEYMLPVMDNKPYEEFWVVLLTRSNSIISREMISIGSLTASLADPRKIYKLAIEKLAAAIILCHNHPSGNLKPSESDIQLTKKLKEGGLLLDISVLDHLIFGENAYFSFADTGLI
ncbi:MAG: DNA repair protein RadC [Bacteroidales bacterium]|nr:DNA repair protein RadC [Bacteroidales bacterium]